MGYMAGKGCRECFTFGFTHWKNHPTYRFLPFGECLNSLLPLLGLHSCIGSWTLTWTLRVPAVSDLSPIKKWVEKKKWVWLLDKVFHEDLGPYCASSCVSVHLWGGGLRLQQPGPAVHLAISSLHLMWTILCFSKTQKIMEFWITILGCWQSHLNALGKDRTLSH